MSSFENLKCTTRVPADIVIQIANLFHAFSVRWSCFAHFIFLFISSTIIFASEGRSAKIDIG